MQVFNLEKEYITKNGKIICALRNLNFSFPEKGMIFILGKSGSGKSTLLKLLAGLENPTKGEIVFEGKKISEMDKREQGFYRNTCCGFVFQEYNVIPELTVSENITLAIEMQGIKDTESRLKDVLKQVDLVGYEKRKITELSGGQKQRVAIARALIKESKIIFADEPTGALDSKTSETILSLLREISKEKLVVIVTHEREFAEKYGDRTIELADGEIIKDGKCESIKDKSGKDIFLAKKASLPLKTVFKMGSSNFKYHPFRLIVVIILSILSFALFGIAFSFAHAESKEVSVRIIYTAGGIESSLYKKGRDGLLTPITDEDYQHITQFNDISALRVLESEIEVEEIEVKQLSIYNSILPSAYAFIEEKDITDYGFDYVGTFAKKANEVMLTEYTAKQLLAEDETERDLLGREITVDGTPFVIVAILNTHFNGEDYFALKRTSVKENLSLEEQRLYECLSKDLIGRSHTALYFAREGFVEELQYSKLLISLDKVEKHEILSLYEFSIGTNTFHMENVIIQDVNDVFDTVEPFGKVSLILSLAMGLFSVFLLIYHISQSVEDKYRTIAILKTMGASDFSIMKIFLWEGLVLGITTFIFVIVVSIIGCMGLNNIFTAAIGRNLNIFKMGFGDIILLWLLIIGTSVIGGVLPICKINKAKSIDYIER